MAKVWKKLQRADGDFTGTIDGTSAGDVKSGAVAGTAAKVITDDAFDSNKKLKLTNAVDGLKNSNTTATDVGLGNVTNESKADMFASPTFTGTVAGVDKDAVGLGNVDNTSDATILGGTLTGAVSTSATVGGTAFSTVKSGAASGATANQDSTSTILGGAFTGTIGGTSADDIKSGAAAGATANQDSTSTILGGTLTGAISTSATLDGTAMSSVKSGAAAGATANQDSTSTILGGTLTGTVSSSATIGSTSASTVVSGAGLGATSNQDSTTAIRAGTTAANVGLDKVVNQKVAVVGDKIQLDDVDQTINADKVGGKTQAQVEAAAVTTAESNILDGAPPGLTTLNELAAALGDNASFSTTMTNSLATKGPAPLTLTAEDVDGDSTYSSAANTPSNLSEGQVGVYNGEQYVIIDAS